jgi:hypothetical protein
MTAFPPKDEGPRFFTVEEASALVPALELELGRVAAVRAELDPLVESFGAEAAVAILREHAAAPDGREAAAERMRVLAGEITASVQRLNGLGCLVKDLDTGLVDFYGLRDDEPVFLCWQLGERAVTHWHPIDAGFAGRRPIDGAAPPAPEFPN